MSSITQAIDYNDPGLNDDKKLDIAHIDKAESSTRPDELGLHSVRSVWDELSYKATLRLFWRGVLVCGLAAFSSFTDGYQVRSAPS
jgi:hypothetical protein